jgi:hypothetical protein
MSTLNMRRGLLASLFTLTLLSAPIQAQGESTYQIVKATDSRVWRLNTTTGEIAVCTLGDEQLVCTSSTQAASPPAKSYAELEAEREQQAALEAQQREERRKRSLAMLDRMLSVFRELAFSGSEVDESR